METSIAHEEQQIHLIISSQAQTERVHRSERMGTTVQAIYVLAASGLTPSISLCARGGMQR